MTKRQMTKNRLKGEFELAGWDEQTYTERAGGQRITRASVDQKLRGDVTGTGHVEWLMSYQDDGTARFVGLQEIDGAIGGRDGSVVVESVGTFDGKEAKGTWTVIPGSATGDWEGMSGKGKFSAPHGPTAQFTLDCEL